MTGPAGGSAQEFKARRAPAAAMRVLLPLAALLLLAALAPTAAACTVEPPHVCAMENPAVAVCAWGPCPPATMGGIYVRVLDQTVRLPFPV